MLNPTAAEFQPSGSFQPQSSKIKPQANVANSSPQNAMPRKFSVDNDKHVTQDRKSNKTSQNKLGPKRQGSATDTPQSKKSIPAKPKQPNEIKTKGESGKGRAAGNRVAAAGNNKLMDRRASQIASSVKTKSTSKVQQLEPTSCITIMEAIEPVNLVPGEGSTLSIVNGCELYVQWVRSKNLANIIKVIKL